MATEVIILRDLDDSKPWDEKEWTRIRMGMETNLALQRDARLLPIDVQTTMTLRNKIIGMKKKGLLNTEQLTWLASFLDRSEPIDEMNRMNANFNMQPRQALVLDAIKPEMATQALVAFLHDDSKQQQQQQQGDMPIQESEYHRYLKHVFHVRQEQLALFFQSNDSVLVDSWTNPDSPQTTTWSQYVESTLATERDWLTQIFPTLSSVEQQDLTSNQASALASALLIPPAVHNFLWDPRGVFQMAAADMDMTHKTMNVLNHILFQIHNEVYLTDKRFGQLQSSRINIFTFIQVLFGYIFEQAQALSVDIV